MPDPAASSVPVNVVNPAGANAETWALDGAAQLAGTDNGPIEPAFPTAADIALPTLPVFSALTTGASPCTSAGAIPEKSNAA
jgi:hypothetical protein